MILTLFQGLVGTGWKPLISEQANELGIPLDKLGNAVDKLTEKEIKDA